MNPDWWDLFPAALGAILGAAAAAIPAWWLANKTSKETLKRDQVARREQQEANAFSALVKLISLVNGFADLQRTIQEQVDEAEKAGHGDQPLWCRVQGIVGLKDDQIRFEAQELSILVAAKELDYLTKVILVAERYSTFVAALQDYAVRRRELTDQLPATMRGNVGSIVLNSEEHARVAPRVAELETQIIELRERAARDSKEAAQIAEQFGPIVRTQLGLAGFPTLSISALASKKDATAIS